MHRAELDKIRADNPAYRHFLNARYDKIRFINARWIYKSTIDRNYNKLISITITITITTAITITITITISITFCHTRLNLGFSAKLRIQD